MKATEPTKKPMLKCVPSSNRSQNPEVTRLLSNARRLNELGKVLAQCSVQLKLLNMRLSTFLD